MRRSPWFLLLCCGLMTPALLTVAKAGPNRGGTLVIHDAGIEFSAVNDLIVPPVSVPPRDCATIINEAPVSDSEHQRIWKIYAAFPPQSSPRVKGLTWAIKGTGRIYVTTAGLPDSRFGFEITYGNWPSPPTDEYEECFVGQSFAVVQTSRMIECYWFGGYGYQGATFSTAPRMWGQSCFVDDAVPQRNDDIEGFSSFGFGVAGVTQCPTHVGSCCAADGACTETREVDCPTPSIWHADWDTCEPNPCPPAPLGACCLRCGRTCQIRSELQCLRIHAEAWMGEGTVCEPNPCPQLAGACCVLDGYCTMTTQDACPAPGDWRCGWVCEPNSCPGPFGACCGGQGASCWIDTEGGCAEPGIWHPEWTTCWPDPCPPEPVGACCNEQRGTCDVTRQIDCPQSRSWHPEWTTCQPNPCLRACCAVVSGTCRLASQHDCEGPPYGEWMQWHGEWTACDPNPCPQLVRGACCSARDGICLLDVEANCLAPDTWHGEWLDCSPNPCPAIPGIAACCNPATGHCSLTADSLCVPPRAWHPDRLTCDANPCPQPPRGACCDQVWGACALIPEVDCWEGRVWHSDWTACDPNPCPQPTSYGVCCSARSRRCSIVPAGGCPDDRWFPDWTACDPNPCPDPFPPGACCAPSTGVCFMTRESLCVAPNTWLPDWTSCQPNPCPQPFPSGACCEPEWGLCSVRWEAGCLPPFQWHPERTVCDPNPCPQPGRACCAASGECVVTLETDCDGIWGLRAACVPNACPRLTGACCLADGICRALSQADCDDEQGWYQGNGSDCTPEVCPALYPTERTSWGQVKNRYR